MIIVNGITKVEHSFLHRKLQEKYGKADKCENENCTGKSNRFNWALKKRHSYSSNREDYIQLCVSCHRFYDFNEEIRSNLKAKKFGDLHNKAKLSNKNVLEIVERLNKGESNKSIAALFEIHPTTVCDIKRGKNWSSITKIKRQ